MTLLLRAAAVFGMAALGGLTVSASADATPLNASAASADGFSIQADAIQADASQPVQLSNYAVSVSTAKAAVGEQTTLTVTVTAKGEFKGNVKYPHKIKGIAGSNVDAPSKVRGSANGKSISFSIPVTPTASGSHSLTGEIRFGICDKSQCLMKKAQLNATVVGT